MDMMRAMDSKQSEILMRLEAINSRLRNLEALWDAAEDPAEPEGGEGQVDTSEPQAATPAPASASAAEVEPEHWGHTGPAAAVQGNRRGRKAKGQPPLVEPNVAPPADGPVAEDASANEPPESGTN
jgi:hypothetical protein